NCNIQMVLIGIYLEFTLVDDCFPFPESAQTLGYTRSLLDALPIYALAIKKLAGIHIRERYIDTHGGGFFGISRLLGGNPTNRNIQVFLIRMNSEDTPVYDVIVVREGDQSFENTGVVVANIQRHAVV